MSLKKIVFGPGTLPQAAFFLWKIAFLVLVRCRRRLFLVENCVFGPGTLPQAPFFGEKLCVLVKTKDEGFPAKVS